jgi:hypothetical protein
VSVLSSYTRVRMVGTNTLRSKTQVHISRWESGIPNSNAILCGDFVYYLTTISFMILSIHCFLYQNNYTISLLISFCITKPEQTATELVCQIKIEADKLSANLHKEHHIVSVNFLETFCSARILNLKFSTRRREEKLYWLDNIAQAYVYL